MSDLEAIDQTLSDYYFSQAMDSVRDLLDGCDDGRYVAPERRGRVVESVPMTIESFGGERVTLRLEADAGGMVTQLRELARRAMGT